MNARWMFIAVIALLLAGFAQAGLFNFGTMQQDRVMLVEPGKSAVGRIYVFNIHGDRATHVKAGISGTLPPEFTVTFLPPLHTAHYNVSGVLMPSEENVVVEPVDISTLPKQKPETTDNETEWITMGSVDGFVPAKVLIINVTADKDLPLWKEYDLTVTALANWFDVRESGPVSVGQARDFKFTVRTVTTQYSEEEVASPPAAAASPLSPQEQNIWFYATVGLAVLVLALLAYVLLSRKKR